MNSEEMSDYTIHHFNFLTYTILIITWSLTSNYVTTARYDLLRLKWIPEYRELNHWDILFLACKRKTVKLNNNSRYNKKFLSYFISGSDEN
jgi:hypothetical protein